MTTEELVKSITEWVVANLDLEYRFRTPYPLWTVGVRDLLDHISETTGISKEQIGEWANVS